MVFEMTNPSSQFSEMNERSREVFRLVVKSYLASGEAVGSRTLTRSMSEKVSAATVRNVMQDLELLGLLGSPHVSAGRVPTHQGLRLFVDSLLEVAPLSKEDRTSIETSFHTNNTNAERDVATMLAQVSAALSNITKGASLVLFPKHEAPIRHIEFISLSSDRAIVVLVFSDGRVENRLFTPPPGQTPSSMREAANFLNSFSEGCHLSELRAKIRHEIANRRQEIDSLAQTLVESGLAVWDNSEGMADRLIVRGQSNLLNDVAKEDGLEYIRALFDDLERKRDIAEFLELAEKGEGVRIFIGSENKFFSLSGSSFVVSPYTSVDQKIVGAVGVIGPTRLNYGRIVPIVDYTAQLIGRMISERGTED